MQRFIINTINMLLISLITACSTTVSSSQHSLFKSYNIIQEQMTAITKKSGAMEMFFIEVQSPNDFISEKLMIATLTNGLRSNALNQLIDLLALK